MTDDAAKPPMTGAKRAGDSLDPARKRKRLGELLVDAGLIDEKTLIQALAAQRVRKRRIGQILMEMGAADDVGIARALARQLQVPMARLKDFTVSAEVLALVSHEMAENYLMLPLRLKNRQLTVALVNPLEFNAIDDLRFATGLDIAVAVAPENEMIAALERHYPKHDLMRDFGSGSNIGENLEVVRTVETEEKDELELLKLTNLAPVVKFSNAILADAIKLRASDIHIEPQKASVIVRYRVDGIMREIMKTDRHVHASLVSRIKIVAGMDISIRRMPQDGRARVRYSEKPYDLRVSTIPTSYGEKVTIRILDSDSGKVQLEDLGFSDDALQTILEAIRRPQGIVLVTGPTGSGKSSTLYACLNRLNSPEVNIITVEDPVEFDIDGINQVQINTKAGITFAAGLRSIMRQDPDIVMVGEIRDAETAHIAFQAAQTGHLVLSTLHTNDAPSTVVRLMDLGVEDYLISVSLLAVIAALAAIAVPNYVSYARRARASACAANRRNIELAELEQFMRTQRADLSIPANFRCPSGGEYVWIVNDPADPRYPKIGCSVHAWQDPSPVDEGLASLFSSDFRSMDALEPLIGNWETTDSGLSPKNPGEHRLAFGDPQWADYTVTVNTTLDSGPGYGIYFRADGEKQISGYCFQYDPGYGSGEFLVRKVIGGNEQAPFQRVKFPPGFSVYNQSHEVSITTSGTTGTVRVDGAVIMEFQDDTFASGSAGMRTWSNTSASFHNAEVTGLKGETP